MGFLDDISFPNYLTEEKKRRLKDGLKQFQKDNKEIKYTDFYSSFSHEYFLQGDLIKEIRFPFFNKNLGQYEKRYFDAIIISNTCDIDLSNNRKVIKNVLLAYAIPFRKYIEELKSRRINNVDEVIIQIKNQHYSNLIYFPITKEGLEYIIPLDYICQITPEELEALKPEISENRIESLDQFGFYLFIFKLSYHFCRLPEEQHRK